jgi:tRNA-splicing ligase RtcB
MTTHIGPLEKITDWSWRLPKTFKYGMHVDGIVYASAEMIEKILADKAIDQVANVAMLPGIQHASLAMPDIHWGYGFCIGGVAATDPRDPPPWMTPDSMLAISSVHARPAGGGA